jgi:hypothetical protein
MKIFGIGLSKTGITSLGAALHALGYRVKKFPLSMEDIESYDGATDTSVCTWYRQLDKKYPGSRYIYTTREKHSWLRSCEAMWQRQGAYFAENPFLRNVHERLFATSDFSAPLFSAAYDRYDAQVRSYFANRPNDLLTLSLESERKWEILCNFLNTSVAQIPWPHSNTSTAIEVLSLHLLTLGHDPNVVSLLTGISTGELTARKEQRSNWQFDESILLQDDGWELRRFASQAVKIFGGKSEVSRLCGISDLAVETLLAPNQNRTNNV